MSMIFLYFKISEGALRHFCSYARKQATLFGSLFVHNDIIYVNYMGV